MTPEAFPRISLVIWKSVKQLPVVNNAYSGVGKKFRNSWIPHKYWVPKKKLNSVDKMGGFSKFSKFYGPSLLRDKENS